MINSINLILFDLGNVLFPINFSRINAFVRDNSKIYSEQHFKLFYKQSEFIAFEKGKIDEQDFLKFVNAYWSLNLSYSDFYKWWNSIYEEEHPQMKNLLLQVKSNYRIAGLSNTNITHQQEWQNRYKDLLSLFEKVYCSHELLYSKPENEIYKLTHEQLNCPAEEILFLDDKEENVEVAMRYGFQAIQVIGYDEICVALKSKNLI